MIRGPPKPTLFPSTPLFRSRQGQPPVCRGCLMGGPHGQPLAGSAALVWTLEQCVHPLPRLGEGGRLAAVVRRRLGRARPGRSEEHTSELQSRQYLVCRLLLVKKRQRGQSLL